ncbi:MAG: FAD-binding protein, partial [Clostridiales bacterium]|nr:FAD-binding protein [Clostridiales bacterium]
TAETLDTQLVIVGGGAAVMSACLRAESLVVDVILLDKQSYLGGTIALSGGNQVVMGSQMQIDLGVTEDSVESMVDDFLANGAGLNVEELVTLYAENVGETTDWLAELGLSYDVDGGLHQLAEYTYDRELAYTDGGSGAASTLVDLVEATDATILLSTRATELITDDTGAVVGVIASSDDTEYTINAQAVLLATGGYGNNDDLLSEEMQQALYYGAASATGDGLIMATAEGIDADTILMEYGKRYPNGIEVSEGTAKSTISGNIVGWTMSAILVNAEGNRVVNEKASNRTILEAQLEEEGQLLYLLLDEETFEAWKEAVAANGISASDIETYLSANGSTTPVFIHGDTIAEVAETAGIDPDTLQATVDRYNSFVESGVDEDFGRSADYMTMEIGDGPYYLIEQKPRFATTMGGLVVNTDLQVENTSGEVISGLYAAGEVVGGVMGDDSPSGANNGWALTSGQLAAQSIAEFIQE